MTFHTITHPKELDVLSGKQTKYENLSFGFSSEYLERLKTILGGKHVYQLLAKDEQGNFLGYIASAETIFPEYLFISELFIDPTAQRKGVGSALVQKAIELQNKKN